MNHRLHQLPLANVPALTCGVEWLLVGKRYRDVLSVVLQKLKVQKSLRQHEHDVSPQADNYRDARIWERSCLS